MKNLIFISLIIFLVSCKKKSNNEAVITEPVTLKATVLASGLAFPWEIEEASNNEIWFTEKGGKISRLNTETKLVSTIFTIPDAVSNGEGGLLGMVLHPNFAANPFVYVVYNYNSSAGYREKVVRYNYSNGSFNSPKILLENIPANTYHNGSRLMIGTDNKLYITTGDAGNTSLPQNLNSLSGKILSMNLDGTIPTDNPDANSYVYSYGHRNPQGLTMVGNKIFSSEHGPSNDDEINIIQKGKNYGWPNVEGYIDRNDEIQFSLTNLVEEPIKNWTPTIAPSGLAFYNSNTIPQWKNSLLLAVLKGSKIIQLKLDDSQKLITSSTDFYSGEFGRIRDICVAKSGIVYFCTSNGTNDKIVMVSPEK